MKISMRWLNDYVDVQDLMAAPEKLAAKLTAAGIEVEQIENLAARFKSVVVGHIIEKGQHPNADRLSLCQVDAGQGKNLQIVCGATNHKQGDKVVVALPGAVLPGDFEIKLSKIRNVESYGMLCSEKELGLAAESPGIMILPKDAKVGTPFADFMGFDDVVFELSVTPNRADCLSHFGLAREVGALLGRGYEMPLADFKAAGGSSKKFIDLEVKNSDLCPRYAGRAVFKVKVGPSPDWLKSRLEKVGLKSINNIVDVTNYVMMELGQPLHAFDADQLAGKKIIVDNARKGEKFQSLDGTEYTLAGDELMIRDGNRPVALAGVVGGLNSGVTEKTENIFLESAHFLRDAVRRTARKLGVETDSSYRFSRGTDPEGVVLAMNRACELIQKVAGGQVGSDYHDFYPHRHSHPVIAISHSYLEERLGYPADKKEFETWMKRLGCQTKESKKLGGWEVQAPPYRWDLEAAVDLVEEFARLNGYEHVPETFPPLQTSPAPHGAQYVQENHLNDLLVAEGYLQAINYGFYNSRGAAQFLGPTERLKSVGLPTAVQGIAIKNPLSEDTDVMRTSLLPGLFKNFLHNYRHGLEAGRLFETGFVFGTSDQDYHESCRTALVAWGQPIDLWATTKTERPAVYDLKGSIENLLAKLLITSYQWRKPKPEEVPSFIHPGQAAALFMEGRLIGVLGTLHPSLNLEHKLRHSVAVGEFSFADLMKGQPRLPKARSISKFPAVERDLAFLVPDSVPAEDILKEIRKQSGALLEEAWIFDVFQGGNLEKGHRSVAYKMVFRDSQGTLSEEALTQLQKKLVEGIQKRFNVQVR